MILSGRPPTWRLQRDAAASLATTMKRHVSMTRLGRGLAVSQQVSPQKFLMGSPRRQFVASHANRSSSLRITGTLAPDGEGVTVGQWAALPRTFSLIEVQAFGDLVGDPNPLHQEWSAGARPMLLRQHPLAREGDKGKSRVLLHGMLVASLFTSIFGTLIPGAIYCQQTLHFWAPVYVDEAVVGHIEAPSVQPWRSGGLMLTCSTRVYNNEDDDNGTDCVVGEAKVLLPALEA